MPKKAVLALANGHCFYGFSVGFSGCTHGEVVFNTSITGYQEIITDPSYKNQLITFSFPQIGNTGINQLDIESKSIYTRGLILKDISLILSNWRATDSLQNFLCSNKIVAIGAIDTRALVRIIRSEGAQNGCILTCKGENFTEKEKQKALAYAQDFQGTQGIDYANTVSTTENYTWCQGKYDICKNTYNNTSKNRNRLNVIALDFGVKHSILRILADLGCNISIVPATMSGESIIEMKPDGIFLSNGPGDPEPCKNIISTIQQLLNSEIPMFGICLGHQLLALACGAQTEKMKFGHHGANHPVKDIETGKVLITSQNHSYTVSKQKLPNKLKITHLSLFDNTIQGLEIKNQPVFGFQGHPEAGPGPNDANYLFKKFVELMNDYQQMTRYI